MKDLTLGQFQEIIAIQRGELSEEDKMTEMVAIVSGKTVKEVEEMQLSEFNQLARSVNQYLTSPMPEAKPSKTLAGHGITYEPAKLNRGQYITLNHFISKDVVTNAHYILAAISYNLKTGKHEPAQFEKISEDIQSAKMKDVVASCLFFCQLYAGSMKVLQNYLAGQLMMKGIPMNQAKQQMESLMTVLDGFTTQSRSQTLKT